MNPSYETTRRAIRRGLGLLTVSLGAAVTLLPGSALAAGETITIRQDNAAVAGSSTSFTASGALNPADLYVGGFDIYIFAKDPNWDSTCAATQADEAANSQNSGGRERWVSPASGYEVGNGTSFSQQFKITFDGAGPFLLCGYVNGDFDTFASTELRGTVSAAPGTSTTPTTPSTPGTPTTPKVARPKATKAPKATLKSHKLRCSAGTWSGSPTKLSYAWYRKGTTKKLGAKSTLTVGKSIKGKKVLCKVTASNAGGKTVASSKAITAK